MKRSGNTVQRRSSSQLRSIDAENGRARAMSREMICELLAWYVGMVCSVFDALDVLYGYVVRGVQPSWGKIREG